MLRIYIAYAGQPLISVLNQSIIMSRTVPNAVYVGFTASTGLLQESHQLLDRVFVSFPIEFDEKGQSKVDGIRIILAIVVPILVLMIVVVVTYLFIRRTLKRKRKKMKKKI